MPHPFAILREQQLVSSRQDSRIRLSTIVAARLLKCGGYFPAAPNAVGERGRQSEHGPGQTSHSRESLRRLIPTRRATSPVRRNVI